MTARTPAPLPNRRLVITYTVEWEGRDWMIGIGFDRAAAAREIFIDGVKTGTTMEAWADDTCILVSSLLQESYSATELREKLCAAPEPGSKYAASLAGVVLDRAIAAELEGRAAILEAYACA